MEFKACNEIMWLVLSEGRRDLILGGLVVLSLGGAYELMRVHSRDPLFAITPGQMPACDGVVSRHGLYGTLAGSQQAKLTGPTVQKIDKVAELGADPGPNPDRRVCVAAVFTNAGRKLVSFALSWATETKDDVYLEVPYGID